MGRVDQGADEGGGGDQVYFVLCDVGGGGGREFYDALIFFFSSFSLIILFLSISFLQVRQRRALSISFCTVFHRVPHPPLDPVMAAFLWIFIFVVVVILVVYGFIAVVEPLDTS